MSRSGASGGGIIPLAGSPTLDVMEAVQYVTPLYHRFPGSSKRRRVHGMLHATRAMVASVILANFRYFHGDNILKRMCVTLEVDESQASFVWELAKTAVLFHDIGREDDGVDRWDRKSAEMFYEYVIGQDVDPLAAKKVAEAIANKDYGAYRGSSEYWRYFPEAAADSRWVLAAEPPPRNDLQEFIYEGDCLEMLRVMGGYCLGLKKRGSRGDTISMREARQFNPHYLGIINALVRDEEGGAIIAPHVQRLIMEHRNLIDQQGDSWRGHYDRKISNQYDPVKSGDYSLTTLERVVQDLDHHQALRFFYRSGHPAALVSFDWRKFPSYLYTGLNPREMISPFRLSTGRVVPTYMYYRGIVQPNRVRKEIVHAGFFTEQFRPGSAHSKPMCSMSVLLTGTPTSRLIDAVGYVVHSDALHVYDIAGVDMDTDPALFSSGYYASPLSEAERDDRLGRLFETPGLRYGATAHNECVVQLKEDVSSDALLGIYLVQDGAHRNSVMFDFFKRVKGGEYLREPFSGLLLLRALFLQGVARETLGIELPIIDCSSTLPRPRKVQLDEDYVLKLWLLALEHFIANHFLEALLSIPDLGFLKHYIVGDIRKGDQSVDQYMPLDTYYSPSLKEQVNAGLQRGLSAIIIRELGKRSVARPKNLVQAVLMARWVLSESEAVIEMLCQRGEYEDWLALVGRNLKDRRFKEQVIQVIQSTDPELRSLLVRVCRLLSAYSLDSLNAYYKKRRLHLIAMIKYFFPKDLTVRKDYLILVFIAYYSLWSNVEAIVRLFPLLWDQLELDYTPEELRVLVELYTKVPVDIEIFRTRTNEYVRQMMVMETLRATLERYTVDATREASIRASEESLQQLAVVKIIELLFAIPSAAARKLITYLLNFYRNHPFDFTQSELIAQSGFRRLPSGLWEEAPAMPPAPVAAIEAKPSPEEGLSLEEHIPASGPACRLG